jgi:hypothetical protein
MTECSRKSCIREVHARGLCQIHYHNEMRKGPKLDHARRHQYQLDYGDTHGTDHQRLLREEFLRRRRDVERAAA